VITVTSATLSVPVGTLVNKTYQKDSNGLSVIDNIDGDITSTAKVTVSNVDTSTETTTPLTQTITARDSAGNESTKDIAVTVTAVI
jgi:hypothetical protein